MKNIAAPICKLSNILTVAMNFCSMFFALGIRIYLAQVFLWSGWLKMMDWQGTLNLFQYEYKVPVFSPVLAAYLGTGAELIFASLLLIGLGARIPAIGLLVTNIFTVISYPILMSPEGACFVKDNYLWAALTAVIIFYGHGKLSLDYLLQRKVCKEYQY